MRKLKELQAQLKAGTITKAQYTAEVRKLLDADILDQEAHDEALTFDPDADKPIYTQEEVDAMIVTKSVKLVRKALKDAGIEVDADNKTLLSKVVDLAKIGSGKMEPPKGEEAEALKKAAGKAGTLAADNKQLKLENALLKNVGKHNPVGLNAVVRALSSDYKHLIDIDDESGDVDIKTLERAITKLKVDEPYLFKAEDDNNGGEEGKGGGNTKGFQGKGPGGGSGSDKGLKDQDAKKAKMLEMMGIKQEEKK